MDTVFKALADESRRVLLDALRDRDGRTLNELCELLPDMTRFGVMKHLRVLEEAHLVVSEKVGRNKVHHLNPVPIREIHDRWISRYAEPLVVGLLALRDRAEPVGEATVDCGASFGERSEPKEKPQPEPDVIYPRESLAEGA
jgi:DNA-binding transcriptional ArsR family regulator